MSVDYWLYCIESKKHQRFPRRSRVALSRDAYYLYEEGQAAESRDWSLLPGAALLTPEVFDDGRLNADDAEERDDVCVSRWAEEVAWCRQWWAKGMRVVMIREQTLAEERLIYERRWP